MTPTDHKQQARALADSLNKMDDSQYDGYEEYLDAQQAIIIKHDAATRRATLEEVASEARRFTAVGAVAQWCRQQAKGGA